MQVQLRPVKYVSPYFYSPIRDARWGHGDREVVYPPKKCYYDPNDNQSTLFPVVVSRNDLWKDIFFHPKGSTLVLVMF